jgi:hypothetical protein
MLFNNAVPNAGVSKSNKMSENIWRYHPTTLVEVKVKVKVALEQATKAHRGVDISYTLSLTSAIDEGGWSAPRPGRFTPGKVPVHIVYEAGWAPGSVWTGAENFVSHLPGFDPRTVQPVASRYTD